MKTNSTKTLNRAYQRIITKITRSLHLVNLYFISRKRKYGKIEFSLLIKTALYYKDTRQFTFKYRYKTEMINKKQVISNYYIHI